MNYEIVEPGLGLACASAWNACLDSSRFATHYTGPEFLDEAYFRDKRPFAILATDAATVKGVVTGFFENYDMRCGDPGSPHLCIRHDADVVAVSTTLAAALRAHAGRNTAFISASSWVEIPALQVAGFRGKVVNPPLCTIHTCGCPVVAPARGAIFSASASVSRGPSGFSAGGGEVVCGPAGPLVGLAI